MPEATCWSIPFRSTISRIAWRTRTSSNGGMSMAMQIGIQPPVLDTSTPTFWACRTFTCEGATSVIASIWPPSSAFDCAVASLKSVIVTVSKYGSPVRQ
jgi:hypothetical protein